MLGLRYLYVLALAAWLGGTLALGGLVGPAVLSDLARHDDPVLLATIANVLQQYRYGAYACGALMMVTLVGMRVLGPRPLHFAIRAAIVGAMLLITVYADLGASNPLSSQVAAWSVPSVSMGMMATSTVGGLSLLYWEARE